jgi:hypothetical protein
MKAVEYKDILQMHMLPFLEEMDHPLFQQDNAPIHTAKIVKTFFSTNGVSVIDWVPQSPDLNPIEWLWGYLEKQVRLRPEIPTTLAALERLLEEEWYKLPPGVLGAMVDSMPRRVEAVIQANGHSTRY